MPGHLVNALVSSGILDGRVAMSRTMGLPGVVVWPIPHDRVAAVATLLACHGVVMVYLCLEWQGCGLFGVTPRLQRNGDPLLPVVDDPRTP